MRIGPVCVRLRSRIPEVAAGMRFHYADCVLDESGFADFHVELRAPGGARRWLRPQVDFVLDGTLPFKPLPLGQAWPMFEWGLNWCIANHCNQYLVLHSAVIERNGAAILMPAPPGSGKSTLCAALVLAGWRLLSDELALVSPEDAALHPVPRPICLKNESLAVIRAFRDDASIGPVSHETRKGSVAHLRPPRESVERADEPARARHIVFPRFARDAAMELAPLGKARALVRLVDNAFNYAWLDERAFETLARIVDECECSELTYGRLEEAVALFDRLAGA